MRSFFFHYNKPASASKGKPQVSIHFRNKCYIVDNVVCQVPCQGYARPRQPRWVMKGQASAIEVDKNNIAIIK